ncbi:MAG: hypothetical protein HY040_11515 [Planctomycetes bacterium]|nr:hypothetical protein [Planctomycetota bacterium]
MTFPTVKAFTELLQSTRDSELEKLVTGVVFPGLPFVFEGDPPAYDRMRTHLAVRLGIPVQDIIVIGSGKSGYSLAPDSFPNQYSATRSDVDVLMVAEGLFDAIWYSVLEWHYFVHTRNMNGDEKRWVAAMQKHLWWGALARDDLVADNRGLRSLYLLRPMRDIRSQWFDAFRSLSQVRGLEKLDISGWLYRTWDHAIIYHVDSLRQVKEGLGRKS